MSSKRVKHLVNRPTVPSASPCALEHELLGGRIMQTWSVDSSVFNTATVPLYSKLAFIPVELEDKMQQDLKECRRIAQRFLTSISWAMRPELKGQNFLQEC